MQRNHPPLHYLCLQRKPFQNLEAYSNHQPLISEGSVSGLKLSWVALLLVLLGAPSSGCSALAGTEKLISRDHLKGVGVLAGL